MLRGTVQHCMPPRIIVLVWQGEGHAGCQVRCWDLWQAAGKAVPWSSHPESTHWSTATTMRWIQAMKKGGSSIVQVSVRQFSGLWGTRHCEEVTFWAKERGLLQPVCSHCYALSTTMIRRSQSVKLPPCGTTPNLKLSLSSPLLLPTSLRDHAFIPLLVPWVQGHRGSKDELVETSKTQLQVFHYISGEGAPWLCPMAGGDLAGPGATVGLLEAISLGISCSHADLTSPTEMQHLKHLTMKS